MTRIRVGLVTALALAFMAMGCGKQDGDATVTESGAIQAAPVEQASAPAHAPSEAQLDPAALRAPVATPMAADSLPPDLVASTSATAVTPGEVITISAQGSTDVVEVFLSDGLKKTPLVYDSAGKVWQTVYRVPMRTTTDRLGLSVTAKNGQNRWQRVWIFLQVNRSLSEQEPGC